LLSQPEEEFKMNPNFYFDHLSDFLNRNFLEAGKGPPFFIGKEKNGVLFEGLLTPKGAEGFKKFEGDQSQAEGNRKPCRQ
jgi:hypothetical protein